MRTYAHSFRIPIEVHEWLQSLDKKQRLAIQKSVNYLLKKIQRGQIPSYGHFKQLFKFKQLVYPLFENGAVKIYPNKVSERDLEELEQL